MNNTKTIFKSLLIMIVAISLFTVSCSKDEGGTKTPTNPQPITIIGASITTAFTGLGTITIGKMDFDFNTKFEAGATPTMTGTTSTTADSGEIKMPTAEVLQNKIKSGLKVSGATVDAKVSVNIPDATANTAITITITITPTTGNSFDETKLSPYTKETDGTVKVTLTLKPQDNKNWNGTA